jgi:tripartite-type tricarboxylate transporter receptor subunit TctC
MRTLVCALAAAILGVTAVDARAQDPATGFPAKTIRIVVPFPPGGVTDRLARMVAQKMQENWGQPVVAENRPGASGMIAAEAVAKSAPDGYTLMMGHIGTHAINVSLFSKLPYDPVKDFAPVSLLVSVPNVLLVHPSVPANSVQELVALAKARPGTLNFASPGSGTSGHMSAELFKSLAGIDIVHVPYKGPGPALQDLVAGQVNMPSPPASAVQSRPACPRWPSPASPATRLHPGSRPTRRPERLLRWSTSCKRRWRASSTCRMCAPPSSTSRA